MADLEFPYVYHSHTERCGHAFGKDEEIVIAAINHGVKVLCITDHTPIPNHWQEGIRMKENQLEEYISSWKYLKEKYKDQIEIHIGLEVEYSIENHSYLKDYILNKDIEIFVCGEHCYLIDDELLWCNKTYNGKRSRKELRDTYVEQLVDGMNKGLIKYLAHPDLFINGQHCFDENVELSCRKLIETAIKNNVILEFNIHGIYNHNLDEFCYPNYHFWKLVKNEYPEARITIGLDCHSLDEYIDNYNLRKALKIIQDLDLKIEKEINIKELSDELRKNWSSI